MKFDKLYKFFLISLVVIVIDQIVKLSVYYTMDEGDHFQFFWGFFGDLFKIHYTTNPGMAFGIEFGKEYGKIILSSFRLVAMFLIAIYMRKLYLAEAPKGFLICIALILGGAIGNLVDSIFYGQFLGLTVDNAPTPWFHGKVIDMFFVDIVEFSYRLPWNEFSSHMHLWPIWNIADASIFVSVIIILIFQKRFFRTIEKKKHFTGGRR